MTLLYIGSLLFGGSHLFSILFPGLRDSFRAQLGEKVWKSVYGVVSLVGLVLMVVGFRQAGAEPDFVYDGVAGLKHLTMLLVLLAFMARGIRHGHYHREEHLDVESSGIFWHMCDLIWLLVYPVIYLL